MESDWRRDNIGTGIYQTMTDANLSVIRGSDGESELFVSRMERLYSEARVCSCNAC